MSNHSGSYMLNQVLELLDNEYSFFADKSQEEIIKLFKSFQSIGNEYDCNCTEIFEDIALRYSICLICLNPSDKLDDDGVCCKCSQW